MWGHRQIAISDLGRALRRVDKFKYSDTITPLRLAAVGLTLTALGLTAGCSRSSGDRMAERTSPSLAPRAGLSQANTTSNVDRYSAKTQSDSSPRVASKGEVIRKGGGAYKLGKPYQIAGRWYFPQEDPNYDRSGVASWYGADFHGRKTANGEVYDMNALTAAHPTLPIPSYAYVTSLKTGRTVLVRINDRGPYAKDRIMDLSKRTAEALDVASAGISDVRVKYAGRAPLNGDDSQEQRFLASQPWAHTLVASRSSPQMRGPEWRGRMGLMR